MPLNIHEPNQFKSTGVKFIPTLDIPEFDLSQIDDLSKTLVELENKKIKNIEDNFNNLTKFQDKLTGLYGGTAYGQKLIEDAKKDMGIDDDVFNFSMDQLKDPFYQRGVQTKLSQLMNDPRVMEATIEGKFTKKALEDIRKLGRKDPNMAKVAQERLVKIINDPNSQDTISDFGIDQYKRVDIDQIIQTEFDQFMKENPNFDFVPRQSESGINGYVIIDKVTGDPVLDMSEFQDMVSQKYADDPQFANTLASLQDLDKPSEERQILDEDAIVKHLDEISGKIYNRYKKGRKVDSVIREDVRGNAKFRREQNEILSKSQTDDKIRLEKAKQAKGNFGLTEEHVGIVDKLNERGIRVTPQIIGDILNGKLDETMSKKLDAIKIGQNKKSSVPFDPLDKAVSDFESQGDVNALYGFSNKQEGKFSDIQVSTMSVKDVLNFQKDTGEGNYGDWVMKNNPKSWTGGSVGEGKLKPNISSRPVSMSFGEAVKSGKYSYRSTPVGKYQIVGTLLKEAVKKGIVDENEIFTEDAQHRVIMDKIGTDFKRANNIEDKREILKNTFEGFDKAIDSGEMTISDLDNIINSVENLNTTTNSNSSSIISPFGKSQNTEVSQNKNVEDVPFSENLDNELRLKKEELNKIESEDLFNEIDKQPLIKEIDDLKKHKERVSKSDILINELEEEQKIKLNKYVDKINIENIVTEIGKQVNIPQMLNKDSEGNVINSPVTVRKTKENPPRYQINGRGKLYTIKELKQKLRDSKKYHKSR